MNPSGSFCAILETAITSYLTHHNQRCQPFVWTATADPILDKVTRFWRTNFRDTTLVAARIDRDARGRRYLHVTPSTLFGVVIQR